METLKWLEQGKEISVESAPTVYGDLTYRIVSDVDNGFIRAGISIRSRRPVPVLKLRLRHPEGLKISRATVNGTPASVASDGETVIVDNPEEALEISAFY